MRLFLSINIPRNLHQYCKQLQNQYPDLKKSDQFHTTLQFLGDDIESANRIIDELNKITFTSFEIEMGNVEPFGHTNNIRGVWINCKNNDALNKLSDNIRRVMGNLGYISDYPFTPHITLGRYKNPPTKKPDLLKGEPYKFSVDNFYLMQSTLTALGPNYKIIESFSAKN
ncbi:RNA 2',3'-cyclic phosphodiesterase [Candidatus Peregrinibacteria bacterium]|nr:RNA 2',3'-cyclic phosphodiesterase [Candidatus Peregrinibacteria bacterium]